eukprot:3757629-Prymnesium_polylepis.1
MTQVGDGLSDRLLSQLLSVLRGPLQLLQQRAAGQVIYCALSSTISSCVLSRGTFAGGCWRLPGKDTPSVLEELY